MHEPSHFLNVDLDIEGRASRLGPLVAALEARLLCLHTTIAKGRHSASFELLPERPGVEPTLRSLLGVIERLAPAAQRAWRAARTRDFNVGLQAGRTPHASEYAVPAATLARIAALRARLVVTVYAPFPRPRGNP